MMKYYTFLWVILTCCSCIGFDHPQPADVRDLGKFPRKFRGTWRGINHDTYIIDNKSIKKIHDEIHTFPVSRVKNFLSPYKVKGNMVEYNNDFVTRQYPFELISDTLIRFREHLTEIYGLGDSVRLRALGKYHIVNIRMTDSGDGSFHWLLYLPWLQSDSLMLLRSLGEDPDGQLLKRILDEFPPERKDNIYFHHDFTKRTMEEYIRKGGFANIGDSLRRLPTPQKQ